MRKRYFGKLLSLALSATLAFTSVIPAHAADFDIGDEDVEIAVESDEDFMAEEDAGAIEDEAPVEIAEDDGEETEVGEEAEFDTMADVTLSFTTGSDVKILKAVDTDYGIETGALIAASASNQTVAADSENGYTFIVAPDTANGYELADEFILENVPASGGVSAVYNTYYENYTNSVYGTPTAAQWNDAPTKEDVTKVTSESQKGYTVSDFAVAKGYKVVTLTPALLQDVIAKYHDKNGKWAATAGSIGAGDETVRPVLNIKLANAVQGKLVIEQPTAKGGATVDTIIKANRSLSYDGLGDKKAISDITLNPSTYDIDNATITVRVAEKDGTPIEDFEYTGSSSKVFKAEMEVAMVANVAATLDGTAGKVIQWDKAADKLYFFQGFINTAYQKEWTVNVEIDVTGKKIDTFTLGVDSLKDGYVYAADGTTKLAKVEKTSGTAFATSIEKGKTASIFVTGENDSLGNQRTVSNVYYSIGTSTEKKKLTDADSDIHTFTATLANVSNDIKFFVETEEIVTIDTATTTNFRVYNEKNKVITSSANNRVVSGQPVTLYVEPVAGKAVNKFTYKVGNGSEVTITGTNGKYVTAAVNDALTIAITASTVGQYSVASTGSAVVGSMSGYTTLNPASGSPIRIESVYYGDVAGFKQYWLKTYNDANSGGGTATYDTTNAPNGSGKVFAVVTAMPSDTVTSGLQFGYSVTPAVAGDTWWVSNAAISATGSNRTAKVIMPMLYTGWNQDVDNLSGKTFSLKPLSYKAADGTTTILNDDAWTVTLGSGESEVWYNVNDDKAISGQPYYFRVKTSGASNAAISKVTYQMGSSSTVYDAEYVGMDGGDAIYRTVAVTGNIKITAEEIVASGILVDANSAIDVTLRDGRKVATTAAGATFADSTKVDSTKDLEVYIAPKSAARPYSIVSVRYGSTTYLATKEGWYTIPAADLTAGASITLTAITEQAADSNLYAIEFRNTRVNADSTTTQETGKKDNDQLKNTYNADGKLVSQALTLQVGEQAKLNASGYETRVVFKDGTTPLTAVDKYTPVNTSASTPDDVALFTLGKANSAAIATLTTASSVVKGTKAGTDAVGVTVRQADSAYPAGYSNNTILYTGELPLTVVNEYSNVSLKASSGYVEVGGSGAALSVIGVNGRTGKEETLVTGIGHQYNNIVFEMDPDISTATSPEYGFGSVSSMTATATGSSATVVATKAQSKPIKVVAKLYEDAAKTKLLATLTQSFTVVPAATYVAIPKVEVANGKVYEWPTLNAGEKLPTGVGTFTTPTKNTYVGSDQTKAIALEKTGNLNSAKVTVDMYKVVDPTFTTPTNAKTLKAAVDAGAYVKVDPSKVTYNTIVLLATSNSGTLSDQLLKDRKVEYVSVSGSNGVFTVSPLKKTPVANTAGTGANAFSIEHVYIIPTIDGITKTAVELGFSVTEKFAENNIDFDLAGYKYSADGRYEDKDGIILNSTTGAKVIENSLKTSYLSEYERSVYKDTQWKYNKGVRYVVESGRAFTLPTEADFEASSRDKRAILYGWKATSGQANIVDEKGDPIYSSGTTPAIGFMPGAKIITVGAVTFEAQWAPRYLLNTNVLAGSAASLSNGLVVADVPDAERNEKEEITTAVMDGYDAPLTSIAKGVAIPVVVKAERAYGITAAGAVKKQNIYFTTGFSLAYKAGSDADKQEAVTLNGTTVKGNAPATALQVAPVVATLNDPAESGVTWTVEYANALNVVNATTYTVAFAKGGQDLNTTSTDLAAEYKLTKLTLEKSQDVAKEAVWPVAFISEQALSQVSLTAGNVEYSIDNKNVVEYEANATNKWKLDVTPKAVGTATLTVKVTDNQGNVATGTLPIEVVEDKVDIQLTNKAGTVISAIEALGNVDNSTLTGDTNSDVGKVYAKAILKSDSSVVTGATTSWSIVATDSEVVKNTVWDGSGNVTTASGSVVDATDGTGRKVISVDTSGGIPLVLGTDNENVFVKFTYGGVTYRKPIAVTTYYNLALNGHDEYDGTAYNVTSGSDYLFVLVNGQRQLDAKETAHLEKDVPATITNIKVTAADQKVTRNTAGVATVATIDVDLSKYSAEIVRDKKVLTAAEFKYWFHDAGATSFVYDSGTDTKYADDEFKYIAAATFTSGVYTLTPAMGNASIRSVVTSPATITLVDEKDKDYANVSVSFSPSDTAETLTVTADDYGFFSWSNDKLTTYTQSGASYVGQVAVVTGISPTVDSNKIGWFAVGMKSGKAGKTNLKIYSTTDPDKKVLATIPLRIDGLDTVVPASEIYYIEDGERVKNTTRVIDGSTYVFGEDGKQILGNKVYELNGQKILIRNNVAATAGVWTEGGDSYITDENGVILSGWQTYQNKKYYADPANENKLVDGLQTIDGKKYFFKSLSLATASSSANDYEAVSGSGYYVDKNGNIAANGIFKVDGKNRLFKEDGTIVTYAMTTDGKITVGGMVYIIDKDTNEAEADHEHKWSVKSWVWDEDTYASATATFYCSEGKEEVSYPATITTKTVGNLTTYTATVTFDGKDWTDARAILKKSEEDPGTKVDAEQVEVIQEKGLYVDGLYDYTYTGNAIKPAIKAYWFTGDEEVLLVEGTDYTVKYANNTNAGTASVILTGKGQYDKAFNATYSFKINPYPLEYLYYGQTVGILTGDKAKAPVVKHNKKSIDKLVSVAFEDSAVALKQKVTKAGTYEATVTSLSPNYEGEGTFKLEVGDKANTITADKLTVKATVTKAISKDSSGNVVPAEVSYSLKYKGTELLSTADGFSDMFSIGTSFSWAGKFTTTLYANEGAKIGSYNVVGAKSISVNIKGTALSTQKAAFAALDKKEVPFTGNAWTAHNVFEALEIEKFGNLVEGVDYYVYTTNNTKKGTMSVVFVGDGIYTGTVKKSVKIRALANITDGEYQVFVNDAEYNKDSIPEIPYNAGGAVIKNLKIYALDNNYMLREGVDYTVSYKNNKKVDDVATVTINGKGNYGKGTFTFKVVANELSVDDVYTIPQEVAAKDKAKTTKAPTVYDSVTGKKLAANEFTYTYGEFDEATNTIPATIKGTGNYTGEVTLDAIHVYQTKLTAKLVSVKNTYNYTGTAITPSEEDDFSGLKLGEDFVIVGYKNNIKAGNATVVIKGVGKYGGTANLKFKISKFSKK